MVSTVSRRSIFAAGAAALGAVKAGFATPATAVIQGPVYGTLGDIVGGAWASGPRDGVRLESGLVQDPSELQNRLAYLVSDAEFAAWKRNNGHSPITDGDLVVNVSMSLATKQRIQTRRRYEQWREHEKSWVERELAELMAIPHVTRF